MFRKISLDENKIYLLVPGFIGNYQESFMKNLRDFLLSKEVTVKALEFKGHKLEEKKLATLEEMVFKVKNDFLALRKNNQNKEVVVLAHSQGCVVSLKAVDCFDDNVSFVFFSPVIFIDKVVLKRISSGCFDLLKKGEAVNCQISSTKKRLIDLNWYSSYLKFSVRKEIGRFYQKFLIIRSSDDFIEEENIEFLLDNLKNVNIIRVQGDHSFEDSLGSFDGLLKKIF